MSARFRVRTSGGQELLFASEDVFAEFVRSGDLSSDDVVYDAETKEWASALTHPFVLQIQMAREGAAETGVAHEPRSEEPSDQSEADFASPPEASSLGTDIGLDLAPVPEPLTPEEEAAAFVAEMEAERASEIDPASDAERRSFKMEPGASGLLEAPAAPPWSPAPWASPERSALERDRWEPEPAPALPAQARLEPAKRRRGTGAGWRYAPFAILGGVVITAGVYFGPEFLDSAAGTGAEPSERAPPAATPAAASPLIPDAEEVLRARARERFLAATQGELRGLDEIPDIWLRGAYLAAPSDYPAVRAVWEEYLATVREVRAGEVERYRASYARALEEARVADTLRSARIERAVADFQARGQWRAAHWDRVEALALAAIEGHDALVRVEGSIAYRPVTGLLLSSDPAIEAVGRGPEAQALLEQVLDFILARLQGEGGPGQAANVREWVWVGFLDAVAS
jgi:hypothetical protein